MRRCLIAGCGDVGTRLAARLAARGVEVFALRRAAVALPAPVRTLRGDLADPATLGGLPDVEAVAYLPAPGRRDEAAYRAVFVDGPRNLLAALPAPPARFVFVSSSAVWGDHAGACVDEDTPADPPAFNGRVLLDAEAALRALHPAAVVVRCAGLYGPGRDALVRRVRGGAGGRDDAWTNRIHADDAAGALAHVLGLDAPAPLYVAVDDAPAPQREVMAWIAARLGLPEPPRTAGGDDPMLSGNKRLSNARLRASGFELTYPDWRAGYAALLDAAR